MLLPFYFRAGIYSTRYRIDVSLEAIPVNSLLVLLKISGFADYITDIVVTSLRLRIVLL